jgi:diketogulonate reductase-like aldo/keto reductase
MKVMVGIDLQLVLKNFGGYIDVMLVHWPGIFNLKPEDPQNEIKRHEYY